MRGGAIVATNITKEYGATVVLDRVSLTIPPGARIGVVGPNGSGKSTLLRVLSGADEPSAGRVERVGTVCYLPQEPERRDGETLLGYLARRTGVADAEARMEQGDHDAVDDFLTLGGADLERRARKVCAQLGLDISLDAELPTLSGGEAARVSLGALLLSRYDVLCLDEPTNDLDFDGLERLERFVERFAGPIVLVSHDRAFLDRTVTRIVAFEAETRRIAEFAGTHEEFEAERLRSLDRQQAAYADFADERARFGDLLGARREQARHGLNLGRRETQALKSKVAQAKRRLERLDEVEKPWSPWQLSEGAQRRPGRAPQRCSRRPRGFPARPGRPHCRLGRSHCDCRPQRRRQNDSAARAPRRLVARRGNANDRHRRRRRRARPAARAVRLG